MDIQEMIDNGAIIHSQSEVRGYNLCTTLRSVSDLGLTRVKESNYNNAIIAKDIIHEFILGNIDETEVEDYVDQGVGAEYETTQTGKERKQALARIIRRYVHNERRNLVIPEAKIINVNGSLFRVRPDALHATATEIEAIVYRCAKPGTNFTHRGKKRDQSVTTCTELYLMIEYLKQFVPKGETRTLKASYYFLKKNNDNVQWTNSFFSDDNIFTLEDVWANDDTATVTDIERELQRMVDEWEVGRECDGESCKGCLCEAACNFVKSPEHAEKKVSKKKAVQPSPEQQKVVDFDRGEARVIAGAGAGKTECVVQRYKTLIKKMMAEGMSVHDACRSILMITFTEAGCKEMRERVRTRLEEEDIYADAEDFVVKTFNQFAYEIVRSHYEDVGYTADPKVIDDVRQAVIIKGLLENHYVSGLDYLNFTLNMPKKYGALAATVGVFNKIKEQQLDPDDLNFNTDLQGAIYQTPYKILPTTTISSLGSLYSDYQDLLIQNNLITFADQEPMMFKILDKHPEIIDELGFSHIIVDEFQDSNEVQLETIGRLMKAKNYRSSMVVGDDAQGIFGFRNTDPTNIINYFEKLNIANGIDLYLTDNYRSTPQIIALANKIIEQNQNRVEKQLVSKREDGDVPTVKGFYDKKSEYTYIAEEIKRLIDEENYKPEDFAFISFKNDDLVQMGSYLSQVGVPWVMMNPTKLMENSKVVAAINLAEAFYQPDSTILYYNYMNALYDGEIDKVSRDVIKAKLTEFKDQFTNMDVLEIPYQRVLFHDYLHALRAPKVVREDGSVEDGEEKVDEIYDYFIELLEQCEDFPSELQYIIDFKHYGSGVAKRMEQTYRGVVLTTAHSSKGLEWKVVFNSLSSYDNSFLHGNHQDEVEERRRLLFVSLTRARDLLYVTGQYVAYTEAEHGDTYNQFLHECFVCLGKEDEYKPVDPDKYRKKLEKEMAAQKRADDRRSKSKSAWDKFTKNLPGQTSFS